MKVTYTQNRFEIDGVEIINPEVLPITNCYSDEKQYYKCNLLPSTIKTLKDGDSFPLPENIIAEKIDWCRECGAFENEDCKNGPDPCDVKNNTVYRLKLKEPLVDTGSKESQDIIIEDLMNEFAPDWYKNYDDCPNIYEEIKSKFIITRK